jgi:hypothetical protein
MNATAQMIEWFDVYQIAHRVSYSDNRPVAVSPIGKLSVSKVGNYWSVNGRRVSRKFGAAIASYFG